MKVRVISRLVEIQGRLYSLEIEAYDEAEKRGGYHAHAGVG
jgi:predicted thioesterase